MHSKCQKFLGGLSFGIVSLALISSVCAQSVAFETPVKTEPGKSWWETDRDAYRDFINVSESPADVRFDALAEDGHTLVVKNGQIVEFDFPEMYDLESSSDKWGLLSKTGAKIGFIVADFRVHFANGVALIHEPGTRLWKFKARASGGIVFTFKHGQPMAPNFTTEIVGDVRILINVQ
ncbi:MAG: hypothetical protein P4L53_04035 [Candidatus Obscuribacterales bacterium]|nr:hypothetical protein [Candidatus Obscuribacterales bacterium]